MIVAIDNTFLTLFLNPSAIPRPNPATNTPVSHARERIESLIDTIQKMKGTLIVPTPCLAEVLCISELSERVISELARYECIEIAAFDVRASVEFSRVIKAAKQDGDKRSGVIGEWQHLRIDRQIVSIAKSRGATFFYTDDDKQARFAEMAGLSVKHSWDLNLTDARAQGELAGENVWPIIRREKTSTSTSSTPPAS